jgi:hypothetical protein
VGERYGMVSRVGGGLYHILMLNIMSKILLGNIICSSLS